eukprot:g39727.t1
MPANQRTKQHSPDTINGHNLLTRWVWTLQTKMTASLLDDDDDAEANINVDGDVNNETTDDKHQEYYYHDIVKQGDYYPQERGEPALATFVSRSATTPETYTGTRGSEKRDKADTMHTVVDTDDEDNSTSSGGQPRRITQQATVQPLWVGGTGRTYSPAINNALIDESLDFSLLPVSHFDTELHKAILFQNGQAFILRQPIQVEEGEIDARGRLTKSRLYRMDTPDDQPLNPNQRYAPHETAITYFSYNPNHSQHGRL